MTRKIKVAEFVSRLESGGVESMLLNYLGHFSHPENFEFHIVTQDVNDPRCIQQFIDAGYEVDVVTHKRANLIKNVVDIWKLLGQEKFDVVHSHMTLMNFYVLFMARWRGTRTLISHSHNAFIPSNPVKNAIQIMLKLLNRWSANIWMACGHDAGVFMYGKKAMQSGKVLIFNNAIDIDRFAYNEEVRHRMREKMGFSEHTFVIGHVGRFMEQKNQKYLIDVFAELLCMDPDTRMLMLGTGELESEIRNYAHSRDVFETIRFAGSVPNVYDYYQAMDAFVLPSKFEGLPVVAIEAQTADLPVFVSTKVDRSCAIGGRVTFLSTTDSPQKWARAIHEINHNRRGHEVLKEVRQAHYDILIEAPSLERIYNDKLYCGKSH